MESYLEQYEIVLETIGPVHIGCNSSIGKKEYIARRDKGQIQILDPKHFWEGIISRGLQDQYCDLIMKEKRSIQEWLIEHKISNKDVQPWISHTLYSEDRDLFRYLKAGIQLCIKDAYGKPYIPGSSLKGAIRTAVLNRDIWIHPEKYDVVKRSIEAIKYKKSKSYLQKEVRQIEEIGFCTLDRRSQKRDIANDYFAGLYVGDSAPLSEKDLTLFVKADLSLKGNHRKINLVREAIKPGTKIHIPLTIDTRLCKITIEQIMESLQTNEEIYQRYFLNKFRKEKQDNGPVIYLGGGAGYGTKTVMYSILKEKSLRVVGTMLDGMTNGKHHHKEDVKLGVSPHVKKITFYNNSVKDVGKCRISIESCS